MRRALNILLGQPSGSSTVPSVDIEEYPDDLLKEIFLRCNREDLLRFRLVSHRFNQVLSNSFWMEKCQLDGIALPPLEWRRFVNSQGLPFNYMHHYGKNPYARNVLEQLSNHPERASATARSLEWLDYRYNHVFHESPPHGVADSEDVVIEDCMVTSYQLGTRTVVVDLERLGIEPWILDDIRPRIKVSEWHCPRNDCGSKYTLHCELLKENESFDGNVIVPEVRSKTEDVEYPQWSAVGWSKREIVFETYPVGIRKVAVRTKGVDTQFWQGNYGSKFANLSISVEFPEEQKFYSEEEIPDGEVRESDQPRRPPYRTLRRFPLFLRNVPGRNLDG